MSAAPKSIEGTWDEVLKHAGELAGHRLRVTIIDDVQDPFEHPAFDDSPEAADAWVKRLYEWAQNRPPVKLGDDSREAIYGDRLDSIL